MLQFPNAKINLGLQVLRKRSDGYHDISTVMYPVPGLVDALEFVPAKDHDELHVSGLAVPGKNKDNICLKALALLRGEHHIPPLALFLHKAIPMGAGLGGGSADGAFLLKGLNKAYGLGLDQVKLEALAAQLGSDCAFFIKNTAARSEGSGERLTTLDFSLSGKYVLIVYPGFHISTPEAYANIHPNDGDNTAAQLVLDKHPIEWEGILRNDFESFAFKQYPLLKALKNQLYTAGAAYASMTGSGSALFGIFDEHPEGDIQARFSPYFTHVSLL